MSEQQATEMLHWLQIIARDLSQLLELTHQSRMPCAECNGVGKLDGDVSYGDGVMAIERDCVHCNGSGVESN